MQMKTTMRYHFIDVRMSIIIKLSKVGEDVEKRNPYTLLWDFKLVQPLWKHSGDSLKNLKKIAILSSNLISEWNRISKRYLYPHVHCSTFLSNHDILTT